MARNYTNSLAEVTAAYPSSTYSPIEFVDHDINGIAVSSLAITVPSSSPYVIALGHQIKDQSTLIVKDVSLVSYVKRGYDETLASNEVGVDAKRGLLKFAAADAGEGLTVSYTHVGSVYLADIANIIQKEIVALEQNVIKAISSTDNALARYDGTAGALQNSGVTLSDLGVLDGVADINHATGLALSIANTTIASLSATSVNLTTPLDLPAGSAAAPSLQFGDSDTGLYASADGYVDVAVAGSRVARFGASQLWSVQDILLSQGKGIVLDTDQDTKIYCSNDDTLQINVNGSRAGGFAADGDFDFEAKVGINNGSPSYDLDILASGSAPIRIMDTGGEEVFKITGDLTDIENLVVLIGDVSSVSNEVLVKLDNANNRIDLKAVNINANGSINCTGYLGFDGDLNTYITGDGADSISMLVNNASIARATQYYLRNESGSCQMQWMSGNAGTPGYSYNGDTNTGMARTAADTLALVTAGTAAITINPTQDVTLGGELIAPNTTPPASAAAAGTAGQVAFDANYVYYCVASGNWKRAALSTW